MNEGRRHSDLSSVSESEDIEVIRTTKLSQNKLKTNKLSRRLRQTQQSPSSDSSYNVNCHKDFKTPKRHARFRPSASHSADSPGNDSDLQQDIIWDPTSPTPVWNGKGVKKPSASMQAVDISEIANRIAPKNVRPTVPESSLLQWIGDSAVPCTPEVPQPRTRKKSTRQNNVEDLMELAKQFDFTMYQQDKEQVQEAYEGSLKQDADDLGEPGGLENPPPSRNEVTATSKGPASVMLNCGEPQSSDRKATRQETADDFDALFDEPTQRVSGRLSQASSSHSQEGRAPSVALPSKVALSGNTGNPSNVPSASVKKSVGGSKTPVTSRFVDDDWDNDDLLNDSIVLEMTQNPDLFATPKHCSTQIGPSPKQKDFIQKPSAGNGVTGQLPKGNSGNGFDGLYQGKNPKSKNRSTFRLETNPNFHVNETLSGKESSQSPGWKSRKPEHHVGLESRLNGVFQPHKSVHLEPSSRNNMKSQPVSIGGREKITQTPVVQQCSSSMSGSGLPRPVQVGGGVSSVHRFESAKSERNHGVKLAECTEPVRDSLADAMDDDLDSIFASDSLWDDGDDDDLLCQVCEDVEKLSESQTASTAGTGPAQPHAAPDGLKVTAPCVPVKGAAGQNCFMGSLRPAPGQTPCALSRSVSMPRGSDVLGKTTPGVGPVALASGSLVQNNAISTKSCGQPSVSFPPGGSGTWNGQYRFTQLKKTSVTEAANCRGTAVPGHSENSSDVHRSSFKRHVSDPVALTNKVFVPNPVAVKCTEEEIERKKQEAMARRRLRMQMSQKQGGPT